MKEFRPGTPIDEDPDDLAQQARNGDQQAEKRLFERLTVRFRYIAKRYAVEADAEDLAQDACTTVLEKYRTEKFTVGFHAWAYGVLRMKIGNYLQQKKRSGQRESSVPGAGSELTSHPETGIRRHLLDCLSKLVKEKPRYARILNLSHQGFSTSQICERLAMNSNQYYVALNRSRSLLKACLEQKGLTF